VLCNILIEFGIPRKLVKLIKMCLNETCSKVRIGKHMSGAFPTQNLLSFRLLYKNVKIKIYKAIILPVKPDLSR
jgi:hypothetical protein